MKVETIKGMKYTRKTVVPIPATLVVRTETTNGFSTMSIADEDSNVMLLIPVVGEVKKMLREVTNEA